MDIITAIGAFIVSLFIALNVGAMYLYVKRSISLDPNSEMNHAVASRFDSEEERKAYHDQHYRSMGSLAECKLQGYREDFAAARARLDPAAAAKYPAPSARYDDLKK